MKLFTAPPRSRRLLFGNVVVVFLKIFLTMAVWYSLPQQLSAQCDKLPFGFSINGCTVTFFSTSSNPPSPINWGFGDGTTGSGNPVTHIYSGNGTYNVTASYSGFSGTYTCTQPVTLTGCNMGCCSAAFSGQVTRDCGGLFLSLTSECSNGTHSWSVTTVPAGQCYTLVGFNTAMASQTVQLTNINTCTVTRLSVTHTVNCAGGPYTVTQSVDINEDAIFIGRKNATTNLQDYNCVLPGASYSGACPVYVSGIVNTDKNFTFTGTDIQMDPGQTGFDVPAGKTLEFGSNAHLHSSQGTNCNCLWRGVYVNNGGTLRFDGINSTFNATIEDALYAIRMYENSNLFLKKVLFDDNFIGLRATDKDFTLQSYEQNEFHGAGPLKNICSLAGWVDLSIAQLNSSGTTGTPVVYSPDRGYAGWFVNDLTALNFPFLPLFRQNEFVNLVKGMEIYDTDFFMRENSTFL
ncbi:MAG TPA: PKD domain-containing protein, partial [Saprospiraceae bacterium]|nr:PKD domain-containing protein [Saprospiraceae bacterium]